MNAKSQRNKLEVQLKNYKDYVPICSADGLLKLMGEMAKIHLRIEELKNNTISKLTTNVPYYFETKQSRLNFMSNIPPTIPSVLTSKKIYKYKVK